MKFKYVSWLLPIIIMWGGFYLTKDMRFYGHWWELPSMLTGIILWIYAVALVVYTILEE